jgi:hypothetical protein
MNIFDTIVKWLDSMIPASSNPTPIGPTKFVRPTNPDKTPDIFVGKIIDDGSIKCEVVAHHNKNNMHVKILEIKWDRLGTYLDAGKIYPVFKHRGWDNMGLQVWEISPKRMKRSTSQVILQWENGIGWTWDLDM